MYWLTQTVHSSIAKIVNDVEFSQFNLYLTNREKKLYVGQQRVKPQQRLLRLLGLLKEL